LRDGNEYRKQLHERIRILQTRLCQYKLGPREFEGYFKTLRFQKTTSKVHPSV
jgi:hypothetical protein